MSTEQPQEDEQQQPWTGSIICKLPNQNQLTISTSSSETIAQIKEKIHQIEKIPVHIQGLFLFGRPLADTKTLADSKIQQDTMIFMTLQGC